jgi:hypothetical protein
VTSRVIVAIRVDATPELAFDVFTSEIGAWWKPNDLFRFTPRSPGALAFEGAEGGRLIERLPSGKVFEIGTITVWERGSRLVFSWRQATFGKGEDTEVEVRFEQIGQQTRVTVEHRGWDTIPATHVARHTIPDLQFLNLHGEWWQSLLAAFDRHVALSRR